MAERGLARSRTQAARMIAAGGVRVDGEPVLKASARIRADQLIETVAADRYVSRAAHKLLAALDAFPIVVQSRNALDVGASTGGFTQVLLERGAAHVIALDVGHGQLVAEVAADPRVTAIEGFNARSMDVDSLAAVAPGGNRIDLVVADLSFISLRTVLPALVNTVGTAADYVMLIKPQFEVGRAGIREGIVVDPGLRADAVSGVLRAAATLGLPTGGLIASPLPGTAGTSISGLVQHRDRHRSDTMELTGSWRLPVPAQAETFVRPRARHFLVVSHTGRQSSIDAAEEVCRQLVAAGVIPVITADEHADILAQAPDLAPIAILGREVGHLRTGTGHRPRRRRHHPALGRAGARLRGPTARHQPRPRRIPGRERRDDLAETVRRALAGEYEVEERMTLAVRVKVDSEVVYETWALNEATVEKASRERMLEIVIEVDGRPLSTFGCDGVVMSTPTGSTAYAFSAGGPVVWPSLDALLLVPLSPHALFGRALVVGPESVLAVEVLDRTQGTGVLWCDGRRTTACPAVPASSSAVRRCRCGSPGCTPARSPIDW